MNTHSALQKVLTNVAVAAVCGFAFSLFLTTPVLSFVSMRQWIVLGLVGALTFGIVCHRLIDNVATMALTALGGIISGATWVEVRFGQHDTCESSSYSQMLQEALWGMWPYWTVGCLTILAGWYIANRRRSSAALEARTERS